MLSERDGIEREDTGRVRCVAVGYLLTMVLVEGPAGTRAAQWSSRFPSSRGRAERCAQRSQSVDSD